MTTRTDATRLGLIQEFLLTLLNEKTGYFHQVPGWNLNCAVIGAALAELSLDFRIDTDEESLFIIDETPTGNSILDSILKEISADPVRRSAQYWLERLAPRADEIIDATLDWLTDQKILEHHDGEFWTLSRTVIQGHSTDGGDAANDFVRVRIDRSIFEDEIPEPRDAIIVALINTCDVFRFMYELDEETEARIEFICNMDLIGRSIAAAVNSTLTGPMLRRTAFTKKIPRVPLRKVLFNKHVRSGNIPALFAELTEEFGPAYQIKPPFKKPMTFVAGTKVNDWVHKRGRMYLRTRDYFADFEGVYGAAGVLPSLDGADHFRLRKALSPAYSRRRLSRQLDDLYRMVRTYIADLEVGKSYEATKFCRFMANAQVSPLFVGVETQDILGDVMKYKERALMVHIMKVLPKFMLKTPSMKRKAKQVDVLLERIQSVHTSAQRAGGERNLAEDLLSLHDSDPQLVPETNLRFVLAAALIASVYFGDMLSFVLYAMASQPDMYEQIRAEADALFNDGDPGESRFDMESMDVTHRFLMECLRVYPIVPMSLRTVMNTCVVEGYELKPGTLLYIAQSAPHYMDSVFPDPYKFDIDRYKPPRNENRGPGYAPYGLGTHTCLGNRWMVLQLTVNTLMVAHYLDLEVRPKNFKMKINPLPSLKPVKKLKFHIAAKRREIPT